MGQTSQDLKIQIRKEIKERLKGLSTAEREEAARAARELLEKQEEWRAAKSILFFAPMADELDVWPLLNDALQAGKTIGFPKFTADNALYTVCRVENGDRDFTIGKFSIREPAEHCPELDINRLDFVLVPGIAFDLQGRRLGRGRGFYDRMLASVRGTTCGVAFDQQIIPKVPVEPHDILLNRILTPLRWVKP
jgi:5-formyltetrahydrofolate cyclo-ligase